MSVPLIHVTPMQHVTTLLVALPVPVSVVILEMAFNVLVSILVKIEPGFCTELFSIASMLC